MKKSLRQMLLIDEVRNWLLARTVERSITQEKLDHAMVWTLGTRPLDNRDDNDGAKTHSDSLFIGEEVTHGYILGTVYADGLPGIYDTDPSRSTVYPLCRRFAVRLRNPCEFLQFVWFSDGGLMVIASVFSDFGPIHGEIVVFHKPDTNKLPAKIRSRKFLDCYTACPACRAAHGHPRCLPDCPNAPRGRRISGFTYANSWEEIVERFRKIEECELMIRMRLYGSGPMLLKEFCLRRYFSFNCTDFQADIIKTKFVESYEFSSKMCTLYGTPAARLGISMENFAECANNFIDDAHHALNMRLDTTPANQSNSLESPDAEKAAVRHEDSEGSRSTNPSTQSPDAPTATKKLGAVQGLRDAGRSTGTPSSEPAGELSDGQVQNNAVGFSAQELICFGVAGEYDACDDGLLGVDVLGDAANSENRAQEDASVETPPHDSQPQAAKAPSSSAFKHKKEEWNIFSCDICNADCVDLAQLEDHIRSVHNSDQTYLCRECGASFVQDSHLAYHIKESHKRERTHKCDICGQTFFARSNLTRHVRMVHEKIRTHQCEQCGLFFVQASGVRRHMARFHPNS